ncbi:hypothetical protein [Dendronalium sp. ChiSLP03b]|uniref:hypothetical protein n=1 Tax=Dendronalium sp. ChiSLP03b TaxID=3075381 RepID=UPI002AD47BCD|nr:hypothetical protein [Dendronalium sp. ChiSLP03b]MDZ8208706.1 hypothetical protein [Dendronalium sp. ChiSLP03b]
MTHHGPAAMDGTTAEHKPKMTFVLRRERSPYVLIPSWWYKISRRRQQVLNLGLEDCDRSAVFFNDLVLLLNFLQQL